MCGRPRKVLNVDTDVRMRALKIRKEFTDDLAFAAHGPELNGRRTCNLSAAREGPSGCEDQNETQNDSVRHGLNSRSTRSAPLPLRVILSTIAADIPLSGLGG